MIEFGWLALFVVVEVISYTAGWRAGVRATTSRYTLVINELTKDLDDGLFAELDHTIKELKTEIENAKKRGNDGKL